MLIEGNTIVKKATIIPRKDIEDSSYLRNHHHSLSKSLETGIREEFSLNLLSTNCFEFVYFKSFTC